MYTPPLPDGTPGGNLHNLYLHVLAERGALGLLALCVLLFAMLSTAYRRFRERPQAHTLCALALLPGFLIANLTETAFQQDIVVFTLCWLLALGGEPSIRPLEGKDGEGRL